MVESDGNLRFGAACRPLRKGGSHLPSNRGGKTGHRPGCVNRQTLPCSFRFCWVPLTGYLGLPSEKGEGVRTSLRELLTGIFCNPKVSKGPMIGAWQILFFENWVRLESIDGSSRLLRAEVGRLAALKAAHTNKRQRYSSPGSPGRTRPGGLKGPRVGPLTASRGWPATTEARTPPGVRVRRPMRATEGPPNEAFSGRRRP